jgi:hypothetical protein
MDIHTTGMCPKATKLASLQWYMNAVDGVGFHCLEVNDDILDPGVRSPAHAASVIAAENKLSCQLLTQDLKELVEEN